MSGLHPVEVVHPGTWVIPVPMEGPLECVYVYVLEAPDGLLLIDAGPPGEKALAAVAGGLRRIGATPSDVKGVLFTHTHIDHYGLAHALQELTGAWLAAHATEHDELSRLAGYDATSLESDLRAFSVHGAELDALLTALVPRAERIPVLAPPERAIEDGQRFPLRHGELVALHTPGHAAGHVCFIHAEAGALISGDHVLSSTTPNVGLSSTESGSPLTDYLGSLGRVETLDGLISLPGHEEQIPVAPRARALIDHHEARLSEAADAVRDGHTTVRAVAERMTWSLPWRDYGPLDNLLAMREALAHLAVLEERGILEREESTPRRWRA